MPEYLWYNEQQYVKVCGDWYTYPDRVMVSNVLHNILEKEYLSQYKST